MSIRQIVLDTETTGLEVKQGHRIIEIGCVELIDRQLTGNNYQQFLNPEREIDEGAVEIHGIELDDLKDKPRFMDIAEGFLEYVKGAELVIHNAAFDVGFLNVELANVGRNLGRVEDYCGVFDTLHLARKMYPGQRNSLDALCQRHFIDNTQRTLHGALLDSEILADVYLSMTGGQLNLLASLDQSTGSAEQKHVYEGERDNVVLIKANPDELNDHEKWLKLLENETGERCLWRDH